LEKLSAAYLIIAAAGIGLAIYVAYDYLTASFGSCYINSFINCGGVYHSGHTSLFGVQFWETGLVWFPLAFAIGLVTSRRGKTLVNSEILLPLLMLGNVFTIYLWYLEIGVIHEICPLCVGLYVVNYALTAIVLIPILKVEPSSSRESFDKTDAPATSQGQTSISIDRLVRIASRPSIQRQLSHTTR
jgi:uncharacterized membrane protein